MGALIITVATLVSIALWATRRTRPTVKPFVGSIGIGAGRTRAKMTIGCAFEVSLIALVIAVGSAIILSRGVLRWLAIAPAIS